MTNCCLPSASSLQKQSFSLKPTTTVVRHLPIVAEGWEAAALGGDTFSSNEMEDVTANRAAMKAFQQALVAQKGLLEPTLTVVRHRFCITAPARSTPEPESQPTLKHLHPKHGWTEAHGFRGDSSWELPRQMVHCDVEARPGYASKLAHEYKDSPAVLQAKVDKLARLMEASKHCLIYSGAGISTNSGISDYATRSSSDTPSASDRPKLRSPYEAQPTYAHRALVALHDAQFIQYWVQQNHDGLPQKAGLPQHALNEIHGAWYDPSNPVVAMSGSLRGDLFSEMLAWEQRADLTLSMGTSMCGMNSDRVFTTVAKKGKQSFNHKGTATAAIGGVIINRQQTQFDHLSCLRIFADLDEVMAMLLESLGMKRRADECLTAMQRPRNFFVPDVAAGAVEGQEDVFRVPYSADGTRHPSHAHRLLDLREGSKVRLTGGPYVGDCGEVLGKNREGHYRIQFRHLVGITRRPFESVLGSWWAQAAVRGDVDMIPVVNIL